MSKRNAPPWIRQADNLFKTETRGNSGRNAEVYKSYKWRKYSSGFTKGHPCENPNCPVLATITDHIIPITHGGAVYDRRNWQRLCEKHHAKKSGKERHGKIELYIETPHGRIPARNQHLPPDIVGQSYLLKQ